MAPAEKDFPGGVAADSAAFLAATVGGLVMGLASGVVTARVLGPRDRGVYSVVLLLIALGAPLGSLGLGDAAMIQVRSGRTAPTAALGATLTAFLAATAVAAGALALVVVAALHGSVVLAFAAATALAMTALSAVLSPVLISVGRSRTSSLAFFATSGVTTVVLVVSLTGGGGTAAAVVSSAAGGCAGCAVAWWGLHSRGVRLQLRSDRDYLGRALRYGLPSQAGIVLSSLAARVDLLVVYALLDPPAAGQYSVALTMALLAAVAASSVAYGAFPLLAGVPVLEATALATRTLRAGVAATLLAVPPLLLAAVVGLPFVFGQDYRAAAGPGAVLVVGGAVNGLLFLAARLAAARGAPSVLSSASLLFVVVMVAGDLVLIPRVGLAGAAFAALVGAVAGAASAVRSLSRLLPGVWSRAVVPGPVDVVELARLPGRLMGPALGRRHGGRR